MPTYRRTSPKSSRTLSGSPIPSSPTRNRSRFGLPQTERGGSIASQEQIMNKPRSAGELGDEFPYSLPAMCYIEVSSDGTVSWGTEPETYERVESGESCLYAVWPGKLVHMKRIQMAPTSPSMSGSTADARFLTSDRSRLICRYSVDGMSQRRAGGAAETTVNTYAFAARAWPDENHVVRATQLNERTRLHVVP